MDFWTSLLSSIAANFAVIIATLLSPLLAVIVTIIYQNRDQQHRLRLSIFTDLMKHRRLRLSPDFVNALNIVPVVFHKNRNVIQALSELSAVIGSNDWTIAEDDPRRSEVINRLDQLVETKVTVLLGYMSQDLRISVDQLTILQGAYLPQGWVDKEEREESIKVNLDAILGGRRQLPIGAIIYPTPPPTEPTPIPVDKAGALPPPSKPVKKRRKRAG